jgi:hypothetical protein
VLTSNVSILDGLCLLGFLLRKHRWCAVVVVVVVFVVVIIPIILVPIVVRCLGLSSTLILLVDLLIYFDAVMVVLVLILGPEEGNVNAVVSKRI